MNVLFKTLLPATVAAAVLFTAQLALSAEPSSEYCEKQLPVELFIQLNAEYPGYRAPRSTDNLAEDIATNLSNGGTGCLSVAQGDFKGSGHRTLIVALTALRGDAYVVVEAEQAGESWKLSELLRDREGRQRLYIDSAQVGHYDHVESYDPDPSKGELASLNCPHPGVVIGATESTGIVYCFVRGKWQHLPIID